ncbi:MAG: hypothetical protein QOG40_540 [Solirubrobacteraceae bacterium]|jgi:hypothetical protein|nr:hypothetical protein [Solirubrobacteraceae bacterium]
MTRHRRLPGQTRRGARCWVLAALVALSAIATATAPAGASPAAHAARNCSLPKYPGLGYFTSLSVSGTSCSTGVKLVFAYYKCRTHYGRKGTCHSSVLGYSCHEVRRSIPTEIDARVTCKHGTATVIHTYQQDT